MRIRRIALAGIAMLSSSALRAETGSHPAAVVELFTSQGCSSCPPADAVLHKLAARTDVIALSLPVDYWDHLGWKDTLASPKFSSRQRAYAHSLGTGNVYTPQAVINGEAETVGSSTARIEKAIETTSRERSEHGVSVHGSVGNGRIDVEIGAASPGATAPAATVWLATVEPEVLVDVKQGENRGKTLTYSNVVRELIPAGMWSGKAVSLELPTAAVMRPGTKCAVIVQAGETGRVVGAAWLDQR